MWSPQIQPGAVRMFTSASPFLSPRGGSNCWAARPAVLDAWKRRLLYDVPPMSLEYAPILPCDRGCKTCSFAAQRRGVGADQLRLGVLPEPDDVTVATPETAMRV